MNDRRLPQSASGWKRQDHQSFQPGAWVLSAFVPWHRNQGKRFFPFRLLPGFRALSPCGAYGEGGASLREHVGTCGTGSGESLGVRRILGSIVLLIRCS
jgi:hypothetical protein